MMTGSALIERAGSQSCHQGNGDDVIVDQVHQNSPTIDRQTSVKKVCMPAHRDVESTLNMGRRFTAEMGLES